jgi:hypothetical protein
MKLTVLHKSGWQGSKWNVYGTYANQDEAMAAIEAQPDHERNDARGDFYHTEIKRHRKPLAKMVNPDNGLVTFSDGTKAVW